MTDQHNKSKCPDCIEREAKKAQSKINGRVRHVYRELIAGTYSGSQEFHEELARIKRDFAAERKRQLQSGGCPVTINRRVTVARDDQVLGLARRIVGASDGE
jgi:hypothetical protein